MDKRISVYVKGDRDSSSYYRYYQYFDNIKGIVVSYHVMYPRWVQNHFSPVGQQNVIIKIIVYIDAYLRMLSGLLHDFFSNPHTVVVSRRIINKFMPISFKLIFSKILNKGAFFIWDFDDHILAGKELTQSDFDFFSKKSDAIFVTHDFLKSLVSPEYHSKVFIMPTTDGDMYKEISDESIQKNRIKSFEEKIELVWVAYSVNLEHLKTVIPFLDKAASILTRPLVLNVICDKPLSEETSHLRINYIPWSKKAAIEGMKNSHIGIMPLKPSEYSKGKGGFKLVQYISIGLPCIASNVGFNKEVIGDNICGILVDTPEEWCEAVLKLSDISVWKGFSSRSFNHWDNNFSYEKNLKKWEDAVLFHKVNE